MEEIKPKHNEKLEVFLKCKSQNTLETLEQDSRKQLKQLVSSERS